MDGVRLFKEPPLSSRLSSLVKSIEGQTYLSHLYSRELFAYYLNSDTQVPRSQMLMAAGTNRGHLQRTRGGRAHGARALPAGGHAARARRRAQGGPGAGARRGECATTPTVYYRESRTISTLSLWSYGDCAQARPST